MGSHTTPSFCVENPEERLERVRHKFPVDDFLGLMDNVAPEGHGVLTLRTRRRAPTRDGYKRVKNDDVTVWGPYMDAVLEPGEYACVLSASNTTDTGNGAIYYKRKSDNAIEIIDTVVDNRREAGKDAARECRHKFGFEPTVYPSSVEGQAKFDHDPFVLFSGMRTLELALTGPEPGLTMEPGCPNCAGRNLSGQPPHSDFYIERSTCENCGTAYAEIDRSKLPAPTDSCNCGGEFSEYERQYADLGSTAFECRDCGLITFDTLQLAAEALNPSVAYQDREIVHPDHVGYYEGHGKRSVWPPESA